MAGWFGTINDSYRERRSGYLAGNDGAGRSAANYDYVELCCGINTVHFIGPNQSAQTKALNLRLLLGALNVDGIGKLAVTGAGLLGDKTELVPFGIEIIQRLREAR